ncbi:MAG: pantothenate kinase [Chamaesiphon sp.]|nr:pantothenate kinase [Chamaesiphon sp.]
MNQNIQIGLSIGNSRYHWAWFLNTKLQSSWDTEYLTINRFSQLFPINLQAIIKTDQLKLNTIPIYLISVVSNQTEIWQKSPQVKQIILTDIPLLNIYATLGIDRALAAFGAGEIYGYPVLVIDGGTALTITGIDQNQCLVGGAILPGLRLQLQSLATGTAALPAVELPRQLPPRWSDNTPESIASGILHTVSSGISDFIQDWQRLYPQSQIVFTGGDGAALINYLQPNLLNNVKLDRDLSFHGLSAILV